MISIITIFITRRNLQIMHHGGKKVVFRWNYGQLFCLPKIKPELFGYLRASTISPKQAAAHQEMFFTIAKRTWPHFKFFSCTFYDITWCSCRFTVTRRVSLVGQEWLIFPVHLRFLVASCCSIFSFLCVVLYTIACPFSVGHCIVCPFVTFPLVIVLSVLL